MATRKQKMHPLATRAEILQLSHLLPALWRGVTRATRASDRMPALESQVTILRRLVDVESQSPAELAEELHLARSTVSNLLRTLERDGLVKRQRSTTDSRSVDVLATDYGREVLGSFRRGRAEVLSDAVEALSAIDRNAILQALPALERLHEHLDLMFDQAEDERRQSVASARKMHM